MEYDLMLKRAYALLPEKSKEGERFKMPRAEVVMQGSRTIFSNFGGVIKQLKRDEKHAFKFFTRQSGSAANMDEGRLVFKGRFTPEEIQRMLEDYISRYVLCRECRKPDTVFVERQGVKMLKCEACGALSPVR